jgi:signal transduction histidine kinase
MRRRIGFAILSVTAVAVTMFGLPLAYVVERLYLADARTTLEREATLMARDVPTDFATTTDPIDLPSSRPGIDVALYRLDGSLVSGTGPGTADRVVRLALADTISSIDNGDRLAAGVPVAVNEQIVGAIRADTSTHAAEHRAHIAWLLMAGLGAVVVALAGVLAVIEANRVSRPLLRVRNAAVRLGSGDYQLDVPPAGVRELDDLVSALTATGVRLGRAMARERDLTAHVSHQLRTPIAGLQLALETELAAPRGDPALALHECIAIADRLDATVTELIALAREPGRAELLGVGRLFEGVRERWHGPLAALGRRLDLLSVAPPVTVLASNAAVGHAVDILVDNAVRHGHGTVTVTLEPIAGGVVIAVSDEGPGPLPHEWPSGERSADGHGIGLSLAATLVEGEGGRLRRPTPTAPATFGLVLTALARPATTHP